MEAALHFFFLAVAEIRDPLMPLWAMELTAKILLYAWLFCLGATVGSFLNVVVYRLPRGKNLAVPGSQCPACGHAIRLCDNIPILSWLVLRGRCRDCGSRISPRYLAVEALVATTFLVVLAGEHFVPALSWAAVMRRNLTPYDGAAFWGMYGLHLALVTTIYAAVLIAGNGFVAPARLFWPVLVVGLVMPLVWPQVRSVPATSSIVLAWSAGLVDGMAGLATGLVVGGAFKLLGWRGELGAEDRGLRAGLLRLAPVALTGSLGLVVGWQRTLWLGPATLVACGGMASLFANWSVDAEMTPAAVEPLAIPEITATTGAPPESDTLQDEVHIVSPPTEPIEPS